MVMRYLLLCLALVTGSPQVMAAALPEQIRLVSEAWIDYTNADGTGLAWDVLRKVYEPAGVKVDIQSAPYSRAIGLVKRGQADAWVGAYKNEKDYAYPRWHFDMDHIYVLGLASRPVPTLQTIGQYRLAWVRSYEFKQYLPNVDQFREIQRREGILPMLEHDRVDFYIDSLTEVDYVMGQAPDKRLFRRSHLTELPLYLAFGEGPDSQALRDLFDQRMETLVRNGELRPIFERWEQPYPFTRQSRPQ